MARQMLAGEQYKLVIRGRINSADVWENVHYYRMFLQTGTGCDEADFAMAWYSAFHGDLQAILSVLVTLENIDIQRVDPNGKPNRPAITVPLTGIAGTVAGDMLPNVMSGIISLQTALVGSRYRGRTFLPPTGESLNNAAGFPSSAWMTLGIALAVDYMTNVTGVTGGNSTRGELVVLSRAHSTSEAVTNAFPVQRWGRQARRTPGRGI